MDKQEYIKALKFEQQLQAKIIASKFETVTVKDSGDVINISGREVGSEVFKGDGEAVADGTYELTDGFQFEVKDSKISKVISAVKPAEDTKEADVELADEPTPETESAPTENTIKPEDFKALQDEVAQLKSDFQSLLESLNATKAEAEDFKAKHAATDAKFSALKGIPVSQSVIDNSPKARIKKEKDNASFKRMFEAANKK